MPKQTSKHLDNDKKATKASGEMKHGSGTLMDGIVGGISRNVAPSVIDGIVRGVSRGAAPGLGGQMSSVKSSATPQSRGNFGSGAFAQGA